MKIIYNSFLDSGYYVDYSKVEPQYFFDRRIVGPQGLLEVLEMLTGLSGSYIGVNERKVKYKQILEAFLNNNNNNVFFKDAFKTDPLGTAGELLKYRDQLILTGWNSTVRINSQKIDDLAGVEQFKQIDPGFEDRYMAVLEALKLKDDIDIESIEVKESEEPLHPFFKELFSVLSNKGVAVNYNGDYSTASEDSNLEKIKAAIIDEKDVELNNDKNDNSFQILLFKSDWEAAHFFAAQDLNNASTVIINTINKVFDSVIRSYGKPGTGAKVQDENPALIQLFKLATVLFVKPFNILRYKEYLQMPLHPVPAKLRYRLLKSLTDSGGFNAEEFNGMINDYCEVENVENNKKADYKDFLLLKGSGEETIRVKTVKQFYNSLNSWIVKRMHSGEIESETVKQLNYLKSLNNLLILSLGNTEEIQSKELLRLCDLIYEPLEVKISNAEKDSPDVIAHPGQLIGDVDLTIWLDFYNSEIVPEKYNFLNDSELNDLEGEGCKVWKRSEQTSAVFDGFKNAILRTQERICLVVVEKSGDDAAVDHPLYSYLRAKISNIEDFIIPVSLDSNIEITGWKKIPVINRNNVLLPEKQNYIHIDNGDKIPPREKESYSSVELLIQHPFDWLFQYPLKINPGFTYDVKDVETTMGDVAHGFIHDIITGNDKDLTRIKESIKKSYNDLLSDAILKHGALLLLDENRFVRERLISQLESSLNKLIEIIEENNLIITGTEVKYEGKLPALNYQLFDSYIDLLLENKNTGKKYVFDLKWTRKDSKYLSKLKNGKAIQLELYKELIESKDNAGEVITAYFLLSHGVLISAYEFKNNEGVVKIDSEVVNVIDKISNSINFRKNELNKGIVEDAENEKISNLDYGKDPKKERIPLDEMSGKKKPNYYSKYGVFKGNYQ